MQLEALAELPGHEPFPSRQAIVRPLGFAELPDDVTGWGIDSLCVNGEEQLIRAEGPIPLFVFGVAQLVIETQRVGERITLGIVNLRDAPAPFECRMHALLAS